MTVLLRPVQPDDLAHTRRWHSDSRLWQLTAGRRLPITLADEANWYSSLSGRNDQAIFVIDRQDEPVGLVGLYDIDWVAGAARTGLMVDPLCHGQGIGTKAYSLLIDYAEHGLGLQRLWAMIATENDSSLRLHDRLTYEREGVLRRHWLVNGVLSDVIVVGRLSSGIGRSSDT